MAEIKEKIDELVNKHLKDSDLFLVETAIAGGNNVKKITVLVDSDEGVNIDACAKLSRNLSQDLDELDVIGEKYTLDVSSPGLDQPLKLERQYKKNVGRNVKVITTEGQEIKGKLKEVQNNGIVIQSTPSKKRPEVVENKINFEQIKHTTVLVSFK